MQPGKISPDAVRAQLERVLASSAFQGAERSRTLLRFLVDQSLDDRTDRLKEYTLGVEAWDAATRSIRARIRSCGRRCRVSEAAWSGTTQPTV